MQNPKWPHVHFNANACYYIFKHYVMLLQIVKFQSRTMVIQLTAPNALCGRVIGRGGTKINGITV